MFDTNFKSILQVAKAFEDPQTCIDYLEKMMWNGVVISPFNPYSKVYKCKDNKYRCKETGKYFNVRTGTMFDSSNVSLQKWFMAIWLITNNKKGISSVQLSLDIDVTQKTAWFMLQRIRNTFGIDKNEPKLSGTVESDESFVGGKNKNRKKSKKVKNSQGRSFKDKTPVLGLLERKESYNVERPHKIIEGRSVKETIVTKAGRVICKVIPNTQLDSVQPIVKKMVEKGSRLISDEWHAYTGLNSDYDHYIVNHAGKEYVNTLDSSIHSNTIEGFWTGLKKSVIAVYHKVSRKHLQKYADESAFRYNTIGLTTTERFNKMLQKSDKRLTYKMLING